MKRFLNLCILVVFLFTAVSAQDRTKVPELPPPAEMNLPQLQKFELSNGLKVVFMEKHEVPLMQVHVVVNAGVSNDPEGKSGTSSMVMSMLMEGAGGKSALELADSIGFLGAQINTGSDYHFSKVILHTPVSKFDKALKLMSDIVIHPDFPADELDRKKIERLTTLMQWHDEPSAIASVAFNKLLYGTDYPYGRPNIGNESSIKSMTAEGLKKFHNTYFNASNAFIAAVGDISRDELKNKLESAFGSWEKGDVTDSKLENAPGVKERTIYLIDKPGSAQSVIYIGDVGVSRSNEDYKAINIMNAILGGSFSSRLNQNLREEHGYTYGASSVFVFRKAAGPFIAGSSVQSEVTDSALIEFMKELNGIRGEIPEEEINRAKNYIALGYPQNFQTVEGVAGEIEEMIEYNLPENYFNTFISGILNTEDSKVRNAAEKYINPDHVIIVVVGDREKIDEDIKNLNLGKVVNMTIEDVLGKVPELN